MQLHTYIMSGAGNMFTVIDRRKHALTLEEAARNTPQLCAPGEFAPDGTEGLMMLDVGDAEHDFHMEFFNPDGSHGAMCGNGGRCALRFAAEVGLVDATPEKRYRFDVLDQTYMAEIVGSNIRLFLPPPRSIDFPCILKLDSHFLPYAYVDVDSDHAVMDIKDVQQVFGGSIRLFDLQHWGSKVRYHKDFEPRGVNLNVFAFNADGTADIRTYERGVEAETGACGTGSVSTALMINKKYGIQTPLELIPPSGEKIIVDFKPSANNIEFCILEGPARIIGTRNVEIDHVATKTDQ